MFSSFGWIFYFSFLLPAHTHTLTTRQTESFLSHLTSLWRKERKKMRELIFVTTNTVNTLQSAPCTPPPHRTLCFTLTSYEVINSMVFIFPVLVCVCECVFVEFQFILYCLWLCEAVWYFDFCTPFNIYIFCCRLLDHDGWNAGRVRLYAVCVTHAFIFHQQHQQSPLFVVVVLLQLFFFFLLSRRSRRLFSFPLFSNFETPIYLPSTFIVPMFVFRITFR